jgi:carotenoid cleavage dioxygenase-like enzyme
MLRSVPGGKTALSLPATVILAAQDFTGQPVARVHLPTRIPLGFHGNWIPDQ